MAVATPAALAGADHGPGAAAPAPTHPLVAAIVWGGLDLLVGITVFMIVLVFTRRPPDSGPGKD